MDITRLEQLLERRTRATTEVTERGDKLGVLVTSGDDLAVRELVQKTGKALHSTRRFDDGAVEYVFVSKYS